MSLYKDLPVDCPACGATSEQAVNFSMENTFLSRKRAEWEADR